MGESSESSQNHYPDAIVEPRKKGWSLVWLVPLIAILVGAGLVVRTVLERGPDITITFKTADGIEPGKTKVRYKNVEIGVVERVELEDDLQHIRAVIRMSKSAKPLLVEDARFWVERPRVSGTNIEGLGTLLSGAFIGMDVGKSEVARREYQGLDRAPLVAFTEPGSHYLLRANQLGSLDTGAPIHYRRVSVGQVVSYEMDREGKGVNIQVFIRAPYDRFVNSETRFWEASGVDVELSAGGVRLETQSLNAMLSGGIAFETRGNPEAAKPVEANTVFRLFERKAQAMAIEDSEVIQVRMLFDESIRGLAVGAPVDFRGFEVGKVTNLGGEIDTKNGVLRMAVDMELYPNRLGKISIRRGKTAKSVREGLDLLVAGGLRGQLRTGSLVSGQLLVSLDYFKDAPRALVTWDNDPPILPTIPGSLVKFEQQATDLILVVGDLVRKLDALPLDKISEDVRDVIKSLDSTLKNVERQLADDSMLQQDLRDTLREVSRAAAEARTVLEYQSRHPESLLRGKAKEE